MLNLNTMFKSVVLKVSNTSVKVVEGMIVAFVDTIEVVFSTVGDLLGVINDNFKRIADLFNRKS